MNLIINKQKFKQFKKEKNTKKKYTILVVDDELANIESLTMILEQEYNILKAKSGLEALAFLRGSNPEIINLIICDQRMPGMSGVEFFAQTIPIIPNTIRMILTGFMDVNDVIDSINEGQIYKFLTKPIEPNNLLITVQRAMEAYELRMQNVKLLEQLKQINGNLENKVQERTKQLQESEEKYRTVFETTGSATVILDDLGINLANAEFCTISGYSREEIESGKLFEEFTLDDDRARLKEYRRLRMLDPDAAPRNYEFRFIDKQGNIRDMLMTVNMILETKKIVASMIDITERKRIAKEIARLDRLNLVGEMAAGIGHEIRNPLTTVRGFLQICRSKEECVQFSEYYDLMIEELDRANSIITEYLSVSKNKAVDLKAQNLNLIANTLFPLIQADAMNSDKYVQMELSEIPNLLLDEKEIRQLILNLVRNGLEAMSAGGHMTIRTFTDSDEVVLTVQDHGHGISGTILEKIGTPFFTTKENGTGLGLSVCNSIAARHNATINIQTGLNGTTIFVRFKLKRD